MFPISPSELLINEVADHPDIFGAVQSVSEARSVENLETDRGTSLHDVHSLRFNLQSLVKCFREHVVGVEIREEQGFDQGGFPQSTLTSHHDIKIGAGQVLGAFLKLSCLRQLDSTEVSVHLLLDWTDWLT